MKKLLALVLALVMVMSMAFASAEDDGKLHIVFWHTRGAGVQENTVNTQCQMFNETIGAEKGIVVEPVYMGGYSDIMQKMQLTNATDEIPTVGVMGNTRVSILVEDGIALDLMPFIKRDGMDYTNFFKGMYECPYNNDETCYSLPYIKSTPVVYYNKTLSDAAGITVPAFPTMAQMEEICKAVTKVENGETTVWGFERLNDFTYYEGALLYQLGEPLWTADGESPALNGGTSMAKVMDDWIRWVNEGWCRPFDSTNASATMQEMMYQGKMFAFWSSCASMTTILNAMTDAGYELGVTNFPCYEGGNFTVPIGGGNIGLCAGRSEEETEAGWEFLKFLFTDEQVALNATMSGYLPVTKSVAEDAGMQAFWAENPLYKIAFDQLEWGIEQSYPYFENNSELKTNIQSVVSTTIQEGKYTTGADAAATMWTENSHLFN